MKTSVENSKPKARYALLTGLVATLCSLLAFAASANAEIGEIVEGAAAAEAVETPAAATELEPTQTAPVIETTSAEAIQPSAEVVSQAPKPADVEAPSVVEPADVAPEDSFIASHVGQVAGTAEQHVQEFAQSVDKSSAAVAAAGNTLLAPGEQMLKTALGPSPDGPLSSPLTPQPGSFLQRPVIGASPLPPVAVELGGMIEGIAADSGASAHLDSTAEARPSTVVETGAIPFRATFGGGPIDRSGSPAPLNVPPPTPGSPGTIASGAGGSLFVPIAALLALLALAAPALLRRLGEVPDFRPPTPFVCALERPG